MSEDRDPYKSEGVLVHTIYNASKLSGSVVSNPVWIRGLQWRIMALVKRLSSTQHCSCMGYFLQCLGDLRTSSWSCFAKAELILVSQNPSLPHFCKKIEHLFHESENDWGYGNFRLWGEIMDPNNGFVSNDSITLEVHVEADVPHGVDWDSKKLTGFVGLRNQGATCYMNSLLQTLYFTNQFRRAVYRIPFKDTESVAFALQRVFFGLQFSRKAVDTKVLTNSFGWKTSDTLMQQDVHEFLRLLIDRLESTIDNAYMKGTFSQLFEGEMISTIECRFVDHRSAITETFHDIQLSIVGKNNILESLDEYVAPEILSGDNKYDAGSHGLQEAEKKVVFSRFPPVLYLHLMRFQYDPVKDSSVKCNDRVEFPEQLNLGRYLVDPAPRSVTYSLHSVLVHSGNNRDGHYVVYINPELKGKWFIFDDDVVCKCSKREAISGNFGGETPEKKEEGLRRQYRNAYVLVYIQDSRKDDILLKVTEADIPQDLFLKLHQKIKTEEIFVRDDEMEYTSVHVLLEDSFTSHEGKDLYDPKNVRYITFGIPKNALLNDLLDALTEYFKFPKHQMRFWPLDENDRPKFLNTDNCLSKSQIRNIDGFTDPWKVFLETLSPDSDQTSLPQFDPKKQVMIFFKVQLHKLNKIVYCGHHYVMATASCIELMKLLNESLSFSKDTMWKMYIEANKSPFSDFEPTEKHTWKNGDIVIFQKSEGCSINCNSSEEILKELRYPVEIILSDLNDDRNGDIIMKTYSKVSYENFLREVSYKLKTEPSLLQLFMSDDKTDSPGVLLQSFNFNMNYFLQCNGDRGTKRLFYKRLTSSEVEMDTQEPPDISGENSSVNEPNVKSKEQS